MDQLTFETVNHERIQAVENAFGASGKSLSRQGRVLMGQGNLMKQGRKRWDAKVFFLFNDILVYGSIIVNGHLYKKQRILPLEDVKLEDTEDGIEIKHQWLICTPIKSFYVSAASYEEKQAWMEHINHCRSSLLKGGGCNPSSVFATSWIPDNVSQICMRCSCKFTPTNRRHHCRKCGFLVCNQCSRNRAVMGHIHATKQQRLCKFCHKEEEKSRQRGDSVGMNDFEEDEHAVSSDEEQVQP